MVAQREFGTSGGGRKPHAAVIGVAEDDGVSDTYAAVRHSRARWGERDAPYSERNLKRG